MSAQPVDVLAVSWAAPTITRSGAALHAVAGGWDIEMADGTWRAANSAADLCAVARECAALARVQGGAR